MSSFLNGLNQLHIIHCYEHLLIKLFRKFQIRGFDYRCHKHIIIRVINKNECSVSTQNHPFAIKIDTQIDWLHLSEDAMRSTYRSDQKKLMKSKTFRKVTMLPIKSIKTVVDFELTYFPITFEDEVR